MRIQCRREPKKKGDFVLATDASTTGFGWSLFRVEQGQLRFVEGGGRLFPARSSREIYHLELDALIESLSNEKVASRMHDKNRITLVVDNSALAHALRNGMSSSDDAQAKIESIYPILSRCEVMLVISAPSLAASLAMR